MLTALKACCDQKNLLWPQDIFIRTMSWVLKPMEVGRESTDVSVLRELAACC